MKRNRKGTTRTGAIPFCMAEVSPERAQRLLWARGMARANAEALRFWDEAIAGWKGAARAYGYDSVQLFARTHPPVPVFDQLCEYDLTQSGWVKLQGEA